MRWVPRCFAAFFDSIDLDRVTQAGGIVRVDSSYDSRKSEGDLDRSVPVTGHFDAGQKEALDLLTGAYMAGLDTMKEGGGRRDVTNGGVAYVNEQRGGLRERNGLGRWRSWSGRRHLPGGGRTLLYFNGLKREVKEAALWLSV